MKRVYLDHCIVSILSQDPARTWREVGLGPVLAKAIDEGRAELWTSPTEVMEIFLTAKTDLQGNILDTADDERRRLDLRTRCAKNVLEMIEAKRIVWAYEFVVVGEFLMKLEKIAPGAVLTRMHFDFFAESHMQVFLGCLGLLAAYPKFGGAAGIEKMKRAKLTSRLLHSRFMKDPAKFVETIVECAREFKTTTDDVFAEFDSRTLDDITAEIDENEKSIVPIKDKVKTRLQRDKKLIAEAYGAAELGYCLIGVFRNAFYALSTFNMDVIKDKWGAIMGNDSKAPAYLGPEGERCTDDIGARVQALETIFRVFTRDRMFLSMLSTDVVLGELEICFNNEELPSGGLTFDSQHAVMLTRTDVFVTRDGNFANLARRAAGAINATKVHTVQVVTDAGELEAALK